MFTDRLNTLLKTIGASNKDIAKFSGFDRTNVSRLRSGVRKPSRTSPTTEKLIDGIYLFSDNKNGLSQLCAVIGFTPDASAEQIRQKLADWLFEGEPGDREKHSTSGRSSSSRASASEGASRGKRKARTALRSSAERLDSVMTLSELSNVRLSQLLHADASLISRYRSGMRSPQSNPVIAEQLSHILLDRVLRTGKMQDLAGMMKIPAGEIDEETFSEWLFRPDELPERNMHIAEDMLGFFDSYTADSGRALPPWEAAAALVNPEAARPVYIGTAGLREAVLRFLGDAVKERAPRLLLYSDEDQSWMTGDPAFLMSWASLMSACVRNGTQIQIVHNIDRDLGEMNDAIRGWLPLYMSGMIESYSSTKPRDRRFSHTIFLSPGRACIEAFHTAGTESGGVYRYNTEPEILSICESEYQTLLKKSQPLMRAVSARPYEGSSDLAVIQNVLSAASMSEELVRSFHEPALTAYWQSAHDALQQRLKDVSVKVCECVPLVPPEKLLIPEGQDTPKDYSLDSAAVEAIPGCPQLYYTPEQYALHIREIIRLSEACPNYRFYPLPETPFPNIRLSISKDCTQVIHALRPELSFGFSHPLLCTAFEGFADSLMEKTRMDRNTLRRTLEEKYLSS
ncbi:MAG: hypothetical protein IJV26_02840 [Lachnospiraceae bacterium]|nr:hypothetical protein [Lachnospiraceae bacterium]